MGRWAEGAAERLGAAALELYRERGYDGTTVADIAERAGVTERTFFRHFADKREVFFAGSDVFRAEFNDAVAAAPEGAAASTLLDAALQAPIALFDAERWAYARLRTELVEANPALREREMLKMADLGATISAAMVGRGLDPAVAAVAAETVVAVFRVAFSRWIAADRPGPIDPYLIEARTALTALTAG